MKYSFHTGDRCKKKNTHTHVKQKLLTAAVTTEISKSTTLLVNHMFENKGLVCV